jgi:uncharacterized protein YqjF (DUF2071 family)
MRHERTVALAAQPLPENACSIVYPSASARRRILTVDGEPLLYADWLRAVIINFEVDADALQQEVPFELDLRQGRAYVSLVAFTMGGMRPRRGGRLAALLFKPIATHHFLNVRAYVKHRGEAGIHFLAEWLDNPISVFLGLPVFGLPYRFGRLHYDHDPRNDLLHGKVTSASGFFGLNSSEDVPRLEYRAESDPSATFRPSVANSLDEFLLERYTAFNARPATSGTGNSAFRRFFRIWHPPWPQIPIHISSLETGLLARTWPWFAEARLVGAHYSPGIRRVWMGRPQSLPY